MLLFDDLQLVFLCLGNSLKCDGGGVDYSWLGGIEGKCTAAAGYLLCWCMEGSLRRGIGDRIRDLEG